MRLESTTRRWRLRHRGHTVDVSGPQCLNVSISPSRCSTTRTENSLPTVGPFRVCRYSSPERTCRQSGAAYTAPCSSKQAAQGQIWIQPPSRPPWFFGNSAGVSRTGPPFQFGRKPGSLVADVSSDPDRPFPRPEKLSFHFHVRSTNNSASWRDGEDPALMRPGWRVSASIRRIFLRNCRNCRSSLIPNPAYCFFHK